MKRYTHYDWYELTELVKEKSGKDTRNWDNFQYPSDEDYRTGNFPAAIWAKSQGYNWEVLNDLPDGKPRNPADIELRIKINQEYQEYRTLHRFENDRKTYKDFWNWMIDNIFCSQSSMQFFNPSEILEDIENEDLGDDNFVKEVLPYYIEVLEEQGCGPEILVVIS